MMSQAVKRTTGTESGADSPDTAVERIAMDARVEEAIQLGCGSLLALEASLHSIKQVPGEHSRAEGSIKASIELVRTSIAELREMVPSPTQSRLALGFVTRRAGPTRRRSTQAAAERPTEPGGAEPPRS